MWVVCIFYMNIICKAYNIRYVLYSYQNKAFNNSTNYSEGKRTG